MNDRVEPIKHDMSMRPARKIRTRRGIFRVVRTQSNLEITAGLGVLAWTMFLGFGAAGCAAARVPDKQRYRQLQHEYPSLMNRSDGDIKILPEDRWADAEQAAAAHLRRQGLPERWSLVGVVAEDQYVVLVRDPVLFPGGSVGTYIRVLQKPLDRHGAVVPMLSGGRLLLVRHYRHATGRWHWEFVRGWADPEDLSLTATAVREAMEEIGLAPEQPRVLGIGYPDTGLLSTEVGVVAGRLESDAVPAPDRKESMADYRLVDESEFLRMIRDGEVDDDLTIAAYARLFAHGVTPLGARATSGPGVK